MQRMGYINEKLTLMKKVNFSETKYEYDLLRIDILHLFLFFTRGGGLRGLRPT